MSFQMMSLSSWIRKQKNYSQKQVIATNARNISVKRQKQFETIIMWEWKVTPLSPEYSNFRGAACNSGNFNFREPKFIPAIFHNLRWFDVHLLCQCIEKPKEKKLKVIAKNMELYVSFPLVFALHWFISIYDHLHGNASEQFSRWRTFSFQTLYSYV